MNERSLLIGLGVAIALSFVAGLVLLFAVGVFDAPPAPPEPTVVSRSGHDLTPWSDERADAIAREELGDEAFRVTRLGEQPETAREPEGAGIYRCAVCRLPLYTTNSLVEGEAFAFWRPYDLAHVANDAGRASCVRCGSHVGHVAADASTPTGERHEPHVVALRHSPGAR